MTVDPVPAAVFMMPVAVNPDGVGMRRRDPFAGDPYVSVAVPAIIAGTPVPARMRPRAGVLDADVWRLDLDIDMLREGRGDAGETEESGGRDEKQVFLHRCGFSFHERVCIDGGMIRGCCRSADGTRQRLTGCGEIFSQMVEVMVCEGSKAAWVERSGRFGRSCPG